MNLIQSFTNDRGETLTVRRETAADHRAVETLVREAFWNVYRPGCLEHYVLHCCRTQPDFVPELDLVLERDGILMGHIMYVRAALAAEPAAPGQTLPAAMTFGPLSIRPDLQGRGYSRFLLESSMRQAAALGAEVLCIEGDSGFYGPSGFVQGARRGVAYADEPRNADVPYFLVKELRAGCLDGLACRYRTPACYFVDEAEAERFDQQFPPRQKQVRAGQL